MFLDPSIHPNSFLARLCRKAPLINTAGKEPLRQIPFLRWDSSSGSKVSTTATIVSIDNGNDALKGVLLHAQAPFLHTKRIVTAYAPEKKQRCEAGVTTWQVNGSERFWMGEDALHLSKAESLPIGMTHERLPDERYRRYLFACLVELLRGAGYGTDGEEGPNEQDLFVQFGVPNEEMHRGGVKDEVRQALISIFNRPYTIRRTDEAGQVTTWIIRLVELNPYPQTFGSFVTWYYTIDGIPVETDIVKHLTLDIGGGQVHQCEVTLGHQAQGRPKLHMTASLLDEGTIAIARAVRERVREQYPGLHWSDVEAQQALVHGHALIEGRYQSIEEIVAEVAMNRSQTILTHVRHLLQDDRNFLMLTGGGSILLAHSLEEVMRLNRKPQSFLFVPKDLASVLNAIGGYMLAQVTAQKVVERMQGSSSHKRDAL